MMKYACALPLHVSDCSKPSSSGTTKVDNILVLLNRMLNKLNELPELVAPLLGLRGKYLYYIPRVCLVYT